MEGERRGGRDDSADDDEEVGVTDFGGCVIVVGVMVKVVGERVEED